MWCIARERYFTYGYTDENVIYVSAYKKVKINKITVKAYNMKKVTIFFKSGNKLVFKCKYFDLKISSFGLFKQK